MPFLFSPSKRKYLSQSLYMIRCAQNDSLPSCEDLLLRIISRSLKSRKTAGSKQAAETIVYRISLSLFDSPNFRLPTGMPTAQGEQLLHICRKCLDHFLESGYISSEEFSDHSDYLTHCDLCFENYSIFR